MKSMVLLAIVFSLLVENFLAVPSLERTKEKSVLNQSDSNSFGISVWESFPYSGQPETPPGVLPVHTDGSQWLIDSSEVLQHTVFNLQEDECSVDLEYRIEINNSDYLTEAEQLVITVIATNGKKKVFTFNNNVLTDPFYFLAEDLNAGYTSNPYRIELTLLLGSNILSQASFNVSIRQFQPNPTILCGAKLAVNMDENCEAIILPENLISGSQCINSDDYYAEFLYPGIGKSINKLTRIGDYEYVLVRIQGRADWDENGHATGDPIPDIEVCRGFVNGKDILPPQVYIDNVVGLKKDVASFEQADFLEGAALLTSNGYHNYEPVSMDLENQPGDQINWHISNSETLDTNIHLLVCSDVDYVFDVPSSWLDTSYVYFTGAAFGNDDCGTTHLLNVQDELLNDECTYYKDEQGTVVTIQGQPVNQVIKRTFLLEDASGNQASCSQLIYFVQPVVVLPDCVYKMDLCQYAGLASAEPTAIGSFPAFVNGASMETKLDQGGCGFAISKEDWEFPEPEGCGYIISRTWAIKNLCRTNEYDWDFITVNQDNEYNCDDPDPEDWQGTRLNFEQDILVRDEVAPTVLCSEEQNVFSVSGFDCLASIIVPEPQVESACNFFWSVEVWEETEEILFGLPTGNLDTTLFLSAVYQENIDRQNFMTLSIIVSDLPQGHYFFKYRVEDECGNIGYSEYCPFLVADKIAPVLKLDDELDISIGQILDPGTTTGSFNRLFVDQLDLGSSDNCSEEVFFEVRRFIPLETINAFIENLSGIGIDDIVLATDPLNPTKIGYWTPWFAHVDFICEDVAQTLAVEVRAWDDANLNGQFQEADDNYVTQILTVNVQDKLAPECIPPHDIEVFCDEVPMDWMEGHTSLQWSAMAELEQSELEFWFQELEQINNTFPFTNDDCEARIEMVDALVNINCGSGTMVRTFEAYDPSGNISTDPCQQTIHIRQRNQYTIKFPRDLSLECSVLPDTNLLEVTSTYCDLMATSTEDERFDVVDSDGHCYFILRTYRVINWCQLSDGIATDTARIGQDDLLPIIISRDEDENGIPGDRDLFVHYNGEENETGQLEGNIAIAPTNVFDDNTNNTNLYWRTLDSNNGIYQYTQKIEIADNTSPELTFQDSVTIYTGSVDNSCLGELSTEIQTLNACIPEIVDINNVNWQQTAPLQTAPVELMINGNLTVHATDVHFSATSEESDSNYLLIKGQFPKGDHLLSIQAVDGCGNSTPATLHFSVVDSLVPIPLCVTFLTTELFLTDLDEDGNPEAANIVHAEAFIQSEAMSCNDAITYSIHRVLTIENGTEVPDPAKTELLIDCQDSKLLPVYIYAWNESGKGERCQAFLEINDHTSICDDSDVGNIRGSVATRQGQSIPEVTLSLSGSSNQVFTTEADGGFQFGNLPVGGDYSITAFKEANPKNGVSTFDLVLITKHILGITPLESPFQHYAADVNNSNSITTLDLIQIRKLILSIDTEFNNSPSWKFYDASPNVDPTADPLNESIAQVININDLNQDLREVNFIGVKTGDVNGDAQIGLENKSGTARKTTVSLQTDNYSLNPVEVYQVAFTLDAINALQGFQFTLEWNQSLSFQQIDYGLLKAEHFGTSSLDQNTLTVSWHTILNAEKPTNNGRNHLFTLTFIATERGILSEALQLNSSITSIEAYNQQDEFLDMELTFFDPNPESTILLTQNYPNPFDQQTTIELYVPEKDLYARFQVFDLTGQSIIEKPISLQKGKNYIELVKDQFPSTGLYYYQLTTDKWSEGKWMMYGK